MLTKPLPHKEARERIAGLPRVSREVMDRMLPELRAYAFTLTGLDVGDQMARVQDTIAAVPAGEKTWAESKQEIAAELAESLGGKVAERRAELLLRTHVFRGYAATRYRTLMEQVDVFPYWQYKTHGDGNVRPSHMALNGKIFPAGHQIWQRIFPPWDWGCRCLVVPLTAGAVQRMQGGGMQPQGNEDDTLFKTQIVRPEVFTPRDADLIDKNQRLPGGVSLNPSQTWAGAPWSMPGNIRHDWPLIEKRYADNPEVLAAFRDWAGKTEMRGTGLIVTEWLQGAPVWRPVMSRADAAEFVRGTAIESAVWHGTQAAAQIQAAGVDVGARNVWYGAGHYVALDPEYAQRFPLEKATDAGHALLEQRVKLRNPFTFETRAEFDAWLKDQGLKNLKRSTRSARVREILQARGYDGIMITNELEGGRNSGPVAVAFDRTQVVTVQS